MSRLIDADLIQYEPMLSAKGNGMYEEAMVAYKSQIDDLPTIESDWNELMVICDNCGHAIKVKRTDAKPTTEPKTISDDAWVEARGGWTNQPERKKGKWISLDDSRGKYNDYGYKCSECGEHSEYEENYCPNCGADMRG